MNSEFFIKWYSDNFNKDISLIGESSTKLFWTYQTSGIELILIITDKAFNLEFVKSYKDVNLQSLSRIDKVVPCSGTEILIIGGYRTSSSWKIFVARLNVNYDFVWFKRYYDISNSISEIISLGSDKYLINGNLIIDDQGQVIKCISGGGDDGFFVYNQNIYSYSLGQSILGSQSSFIGLTRYDINLNYLGYNEYLFNQFFSSITTYFSKGHLIGDSFFYLREASYEGGARQRHLLKIPLDNTSLPSTINVKRLDTSNTFSVSSFISSDNYGFFKLNVSGNGNDTIFRFDEDLDFSGSVEISFDANVEIFSSSESLYLNLNSSDQNIPIISGRSILSAGFSFQSNGCIGFLSAVNPSIVDESLTLNTRTLSINNITITVDNSNVLTVFNETVTPFIQTCPQTYDLSTSTILTEPNTIAADNISTSVISVQLKDYLGNNISNGGENVVINSSKGTISATTDNGDGTYTAILTSSYNPETATLSFTINGEPAIDTAEVIFEELIVRIPQSHHLYLQSAGSTGSDGSAEGIHLRWLLKKDLIKHLPKGNLASTTVNYNKADDFVKIYRAPYVASETTFDLSQAPKVVDNRNAVWLYEVNGIKIYLYFRNKSQYGTVQNTIDPLTQSTQFLAGYGSELLELESKNELFFSLEFNVNAGTSPVVETELLSVEENMLTAEKSITVRKTFTGTSELSNTRMVTENGRSFRFRLINCEITSISLEFYSTLSSNIENGTGWTDLGDFSLSTKDAEVFSRLEPSSDVVNGQWQRFNDNAFVDIQNYKDKWNVTNPNTQSSIKQTVQDYVALSDDENNPSAVESFTFSDVLPDGVTDPSDDSFEIANLTLLQQASLDYHVARMLGLGHLDVDTAVQNNDAFVYMAVYETKVTFQGGQYITEDTEHRYITIPTSKSDERLPSPIDLKQPVPGIYPNNGINEEALPLTDNEGYTQDGKARFVSLFVDEQEDLSVDKGFYNSPTEFNLTETTNPVFAGIEYKGVGETDWRKPELPNTDYYQNSVPSGESPHNETLPLPIPDEGVSLYVHRERENGEHIYGSYGINWFSRASESSVQWNLVTTIQPKDTLVPPHNRSALLIREESPLLLTSSNEQQRLENIPGSDKTLIRLTFDYNTREELMTYKVTPENMNGATDPLDTDAIFPDSQEVFADEVEIYFRSKLPLNVTGKALSVQDHSSNEVLSVITTGSYILDSTGETLIPSIPTAELDNFVGGALALEESEFIIHEVAESADGLDFTVYKKQLSDRLQTGSEPSPNEDLQSPVIKGDGMLMAVENLQNVSSWGTPNPHPLKVQIGDNWTVHRELITREGPDDGVLEEIVEKSRGIWDTALIEEDPQPIGFDGNGQPIEEHRGFYKATFSSTQLSNHPQSSGTNPVEWYKGTIRLHTQDEPNGNRKALDVIKIENVGTSNNLVVYFVDNGFSTDSAYDAIQIGNVQVNFYPGYRVYLYENATAGITESTTLPSAGDGTRYTCFGFRSVGNSGTYASRISVPTVMFAQEEVKPLVPELPVGASYATRPDSFGKSTYTLITQFSHRPHGVQYYRTNDDAILNVLYNPSTVQTVKEGIEQSDMSFLSNRWQNLLGFDYEYPPESYQTDGLFAIYPENEEGYRLPNPDNENLFDVGGGEIPGSIVPGLMADRIQQAIYLLFTPLTEIPILYDYINTGQDYNPINKKQVVRDENGALLPPAPPGTSDFDIAPMAKIVATNKVQFTDFGLDGTSNNLYFYGVKELGNQMQISDFSPILGPIKLVNTNPPKAPSIKKAVPIIEDVILGIAPQIRVEVNAYPKVENIKRIALYRALSASDALSVRSMEKVAEIALDATGQINDNVWEVSDDFSSLVEVPYADPIYYRVVVSREIEYADKDDPNTVVTDYVPSIPSKLLVTGIVENGVPLAPQLSYTADTGAGQLDNVVLEWGKTTYNAKYILFKMTNEGQWAKIYETTSNEETISVPLLQTELATDTLLVEDTDGNNIYHHFKVTVENTSNSISQEDEILTVPMNN